MAKIVALPVPSTDRTKSLFDWAAKVLKDLGLADAVAHATSLAKLRGIALDLDSAEVSLAVPCIRQPASGSTISSASAKERSGKSSGTVSTI